jgi:hypothetical protein
MSNTAKVRTVQGFNMNTKLGRLFNALVINKEVLTEAGIRNRFDIANPTATISKIRQRGYFIHGRQRLAGNGVRVTEYLHTTPSREVVSLGYKAKALGLVV